MSAPKNYVASVKGRLLKVSKETGISHQLLLLRYFQERFLFRLSRSPFKERFCLKGGVLLYALEKESSRVTKDIDFLGIQFPAQSEDLVDALSQIIEIPCLEDGITFEKNNIQTEEIIKDAKYKGVRVVVPGRLGSIRERIKIDFGFGDAVTPFPQRLVYPVILDLPAPEIMAYSLETSIAEKFEAMISLGEVNTRMKDFYDVFHLLKNHSIDHEILEEAIENTFKRRATSLDLDHCLFLPEFSTDPGRNRLWRAWLRKSSLDITLEFSEVMRELLGKIYPIAIRTLEKNRR
jgi:predicted nucleotidyltransferase component of viral defense system